MGTSISQIETHVENILEQERAEQIRASIAWLSPPNLSRIHNEARQRIEPQTGLWLLESECYKGWKRGESHHLWVYGKAGCGKTVLSSSVVEDLRQHCETSRNSKIFYFYFSFADVDKQSYENLLCSLLSQLAQDEPCRSLVQREYQNSTPNPPETSALEKILLNCVSQFQDTFIAMDALDECPDLEDTRQDLLDHLEKLISKAPNIKMFVTSREIHQIGDFMRKQGAKVCPVGIRQVDADIRRFVLGGLSRDPKLYRLKEATKVMILNSFTARSDGMYDEFNQVLSNRVLTNIQVQMGISPTSAIEEPQIYEA